MFNIEHYILGKCDIPADSKLMSVSDISKLFENDNSSANNSNIKMKLKPTPLRNNGNLKSHTYKNELPIINKNISINLENIFNEKKLFSPTVNLKRLKHISNTNPFVKLERLHFTEDTINRTSENPTFLKSTYNENHAKHFSSKANTCAATLSNKKMKQIYMEDRKDIESNPTYFTPKKKRCTATLGNEKSKQIRKEDRKYIESNAQNFSSKANRCATILSNMNDDKSIESNVQSFTKRCAATLAYKKIKQIYRNNNELFPEQITMENREPFTKKKTIMKDKEPLAKERVIMKIKEPFAKKQIKEPFSEKPIIMEDRDISPGKRNENSISKNHETSKNVVHLNKSAGISSSEMICSPKLEEYKLKTPIYNKKTLKYLRQRKEIMDAAIIPADEEDEYFKDKEISNIAKLIGDSDCEDDSILIFKTPTVKLKPSLNITPRARLLQHWTENNNIYSPSARISKKGDTIKQKDCALQVYYHRIKKSRRKRHHKKEVDFSLVEKKMKIMKLPEFENNKTLSTSMDDYFDDSN